MTFLPICTEWPLDRGKEIIIVEGEKTLEAIKNAGFQGLTFIGGSTHKKLVPDMAEAFLKVSGFKPSDLRFNIWPDNDADGSSQRFMKIVKNKLARMGCGLRLVETQQFKKHGIDAADFDKEKIAEILKNADKQGSLNVDNWLADDDWTSKPGDERNRKPLLRFEKYKEIETRFSKRENGLNNHAFHGLQINTAGWPNSDAVEMVFELLGLQCRYEARLEQEQLRGRNLLFGSHVHGSDADNEGWTTPDNQMIAFVKDMIEKKLCRWNPKMERHLPWNYRKQPLKKS